MDFQASDATDFEPTTEVDMTAAPESEGPAPEPPLKRLWTNLREREKDFSVTFDEFERDMADDATLRELHKNLRSRYKDFTLGSDEFVADMRGTAKKKASSEPGSPLSGAGAAVELPVGDEPFVEVPSLPGLQPNLLPEAMLPRAAPQLTEQAPDLRVPVVAVPEVPVLAPGQTFSAQPVEDGFERVPIGQADPYAFQGADPTLVGPRNQDEPGSYLLAEDKGTAREGQRYHDQPLSKVAPGESEEQDSWTAAARNFGNQLLNMVKGGADFLGAADRRLHDSALGRAADSFDEALGAAPYDAADPNVFQAGADAVENLKAPVAPFHERSTFRLTQPATWPMATSNAAALAAPVVLSALLPESKIAGAVQTMLGVGFDGQMLESSFERARQAGLKPGSPEYDAYALADGTATLLTFKLGAAGLSAAGQGLVRTELVKNTLHELRGATERVTQEQLQGAFARAAQKAAPVLREAAKESGQMGLLFGANEAKTVAGGQLTNTAMGQPVFPQQSVGTVAGRVAGAVGEGMIIGGLAGTGRGIGAARTLPANVVALGESTSRGPLFAELGEDGQPARYLDAQGQAVDFGPHGPPPAVHQAVGAAQAQQRATAAPAPEAAARYNVQRPTGQLEMRDVQVMSVSADGKTGLVQGVDAQGAPVEREVPTAYLQQQSTAAPEVVGAAPDPAPVEESMPQRSEAKGPSNEQQTTPAPAYATPAENRAAGRFEKDGQTYTRPEPLGIKLVRGTETVAHFAHNVAQPVQYAVLEAADLQPSHTGGSQNLSHFLPEAQPKNRSAAFDPASQKAIADIAAAPDLGRLSEAPNAYAGAPIINSRGEVVQGNGRAEGIRQHYQQNGESYRAEVVAAAEKVGIPNNQVAEMKEPVLVRVAEVSDQRARELGNYSATDLESGGQRRLDARQAAGRLDADGRTVLTRLTLPQGDATLSETIRANGPELLRLLRTQGLVNATQLQTMAKADGTLTPQGVEDIAALHRHGLFADGDPNLPELFQELPAAAQGGLDRAVGALLSTPEAASLVPEVQDAITGVREFRSSGVDFATWADQADMFRGGESPRSRYTPLTLKLIDILATEKRPTYIAKLFNQYAAIVRGEGASLFGETPPQPRAEAVENTFGVSDDQPRATPGNARAEENAIGRDAANQRPSAPEPLSAPSAPAPDGAGPRPDASANRPGGTGGPAADANNQPRAVAAESAALTLNALNEQLRQALASGDQAAAAEQVAQAEKLAQQQAAHGPEAGRASTAFRILAENAPAAVVHQAEQEVAAQRAQAEAKLERQAATETKQIQREKTEALTHALATPAVQAARAKVAGKTRPTTPEQLATVRAERAGLLDELKQLAKTPNGTAYSSIVPITPAAARAAELHVRVFRTYINEGLVHVRDLVARWKRDAGPLLAGISDADLTKLAATALVDHRAAVRQGVAELGTTLDRIARDYTTAPAAVGTTLAQRFVEGAGLSPAEAQQYAAAIRQEFDRRIATARQRRLDQLNKKAASSPAKRATQTDLNQTRELFALAPTNDAAVLDHLRRITDLPTLTSADAAQLRTLADAITAAPTGFQKDAAVGELLHATAQLKGIDWLEVGNAMWYANVLSGYKTHAVNLFANSLQTGAEVLVHVAHALATGKGRYATATGKGLVQGLQRGAREAVSVLTTGREVSRDGMKFEAPGLLEYRRFTGGAVNPVNYLKYVGRALRAGDVLFSTGLKEMRAHELAVKEALAEGQSGEPSADVWTRVNEKLYRTQQRVAEAQAQATAEGLTGNDHARRVFEIAEQSRDAKLSEEAREYGTRAVFNGEVAGTLGWITTGIQHITQGIDIAGFKPGKYVVPFTRVIANVANAALDYTPVGAARAGISLAREQVGRGSGGHLFGGKATSDMQRQLTSEERGHLAIKSVLGAAAAVAAYSLSHNQDEHGNPTIEISGAGTGNPAKDAQLRADGWQPYSIKAGGKWYSYASTPVGIMLAAIGNLNDGEKYRGEHVEQSDKALQAVFLNSFRALQFAQDMTAMKGAADFLAAADSKSPDQVTSWAQRLAVGTVKGYVPWSSLLTQLAKDEQQLTDQPRKQARTFGQRLVQDLPVARDGLNNALDVLGDPLPVDTDRLVSSPPHRDEPTQAVWDWLDKNNLFISVPNRNSGGAMVLRAHQGKEGPMTDPEYFSFMQRRGQLLKEALRHQLPELQKLAPDQAKRKLQQVVKRVSRDAKQQVFSPTRSVSKR